MLMHAPKVLPLPFLLPSWTASGLRSLRRTPKVQCQSRQISNGDDPPARSGNEAKGTPRSSTKSLMEELFPEVVKQRGKQRKKPPAEEDIPRLPLLSDREDFYNGRLRPVVHPKHKNSPNRIKRFILRPRDPKYLTVLVLQNASKHLVESDFRRAVPRGEHIANWRGHGAMLNVIKGRDPTTLESGGFYFILFTSRKSATAFQQHVAEQYKMSRAHILEPGSSPLPIPPEGDVSLSGDDSGTAPPSHRHPESSLDPSTLPFTLTIPTVEPVLKPLPQPFLDSIQRVIVLGGYGRTIPDQTTSRVDWALTAVLFHISGGAQRTRDQIKKALRADYENGKLPRTWAIVDRGNEIWRVEDVNETAMMTGAEERRSKQQSIRGDQPDERTSDRWIIWFRFPTEAGRFRRMWHKRPFPRDEEVESEEEDWEEEDEEEPIVNVELL